MSNLSHTPEFTVPTREEMSPANQGIYDHMHKAFGMVPNLYATFTYSETALGDYLALQNRKTTLSGKEKEIVNLVVSQVNNCKYCQRAHTAVGKMNGFTDAQILEIRRGDIGFDDKFNALVHFVKETTLNRGRPSEKAVEALFAAGYTKANLVDIVILIGDKIISNYLHGITQIPIDWPEVPQI